jgi:hypothetical protein
VENCRRRVEHNADILILIIGGRYGSIDKATEKSVTNLEFLAARQKGIPIYVFIERKILDVIPIWAINKDADFSGVVDTTSLFEFVEEVRTQTKLWSFPFDTAQDIISILRTQLAYLFKDSLSLRMRLAGKELPPYFNSLGAASLRIALEKPASWEYRLFFQNWIDAVEQRANLLKEYRDKLKLDLAEYVPTVTATDWLQTRFHELDGLVQSMNTLLRDSAMKAFGPEGQPGDAQEIIWVSQMLGSQVLEAILRWSKRIRCSRLEKPFNEVIPELSLMADQIITQISSFPVESLRAIEAALASAPTDEAQRLKLTMVIELANIDAYEEALDRAVADYVASIQ